MLVKKDLEAGFDEIVVICLRKDDKEKVRSELASLGLNAGEKVKMLEVQDI